MEGTPIRFVCLCVVELQLGLENSHLIAFRLETTWQPARDNDIQVAWKLNGMPLGASQLIKTRSDLGYASCDIDATNADHEGVFELTGLRTHLNTRMTTKSVLVRNSVGEATCSATVRVIQLGSILGDTNHEESVRRIRILEEPRAREPTPPPPVYDAPTITTQIADVECDEGEPSSFSAVAQPTNDPNLKVC